MGEVADIAKTEFGRKLSRLAGATANEIHLMVANEPSFKKASAGSLTTYMLNENMIFMQFIEGLIVAHKRFVTAAYEDTMREMDKLREERGL